MLEQQGAQSNRINVASRVPSSVCWTARSVIRDTFCWLNVIISKIMTDVYFLLCKSKNESISKRFHK